MRIWTARPTDLDDVTSLLTDAFAADPLWRWAFDDLDDLRTLWRFYVRSALRYPWVSVADRYAAAAVWIPPGGTELTESEERQLEPLLRRLLGARADAVLSLVDCFDEAHPSAPPHYYLALLGTATPYRGRGLGMALLAESLRRIDREGAPAYLESSNPANDRRYEAFGFSRAGSFRTPDGAHTVTTMWRDHAPG